MVGVVASDGNLFDEEIKVEDSSAGLISYVHDIDIASNEIIFKTQLNRNFLKLRDNDIRLFNQTLITEGTFKKVAFWNSSTIYSVNDLVWYTEYVYDPEQLEWGIKRIVDVRTYLLRSLVNGNRSTPVKVTVNGLANFDDSNWRLVSEISQVLQDSTLSGSEYLSSRIDTELYSQHEVPSEGEHVHGPLSSLSYLSASMMNVDVSNANTERNNVFFVTKTDELAASNTIIKGVARYWTKQTRANKSTTVVEYDIVFQLGDAVVLRFTDEMGNMIITRTISANSFVPYNDIEGGPYANNNSDYYLTKEDMKIFSAYPSNSPDIKLDSMIQTNLNQFVNVYTGTITFPNLFSDLNYMVFSNSSAQKNINTNTLIWTNKTRRSITAMLILPVINTIDSSILRNNQFRCHIIGALHNSDEDDEQ